MEYSLQASKGIFSLDEMALNRMTVNEYMDEWVKVLQMEERGDKIAHRTLLDYLMVVRCHIRPHLGSLAIRSLNSTLVRKWLLEVKAKGVSDRTVEKASRTLYRTMGDSELRSNPIRLPKRHRPQGRKAPRLEYPAPETVAQFIQHLGNCDKAKGRRVDVVLELAAYTGLRRGELCGLAWDDLDLEEGLLSVNQTLQTGEKSSLYIKGPKSDNGYRTIGLPHSMLGTLRRHKSASAEERLRLGQRYNQVPLGRDFLFRGTETGAPLHPDHLTAAMRREWLHAGLAPRTTLHGLRHTIGSALILDGQSVTNVAAHLGDDPTTVSQFYQHELDERKRQASVVSALENLYG